VVVHLDYSHFLLLNKNSARNGLSTRASSLTLNELPELLLAHFPEALNCLLLVLILTSFLVHPFLRLDKVSVAANILLLTVP